MESYSTGMKQRVKLAQAVVHDPGTLFLDEPTNGMDPQGREEMLALIEKLGRGDRTVLVSSHILQEVERVSQYAVIIHQGRVLREGWIDKLMTGDGERHRLKVRGEPGSLDEFSEALASRVVISESREAWGELDLVTDGKLDTRMVFELAMQNGVQVRFIGPDLLSLEDVFIREFQGGAPVGN